VEHHLPFLKNQLRRAPLERTPNNGTTYSTTTNRIYNTSTSVLTVLAYPHCFLLLDLPQQLLLPQLAFAAAGSVICGLDLDEFQGLSARSF
jgi:hypothetical protein